MFRMRRSTHDNGPIVTLYSRIQKVWRRLLGANDIAKATGQFSLPSFFLAGSSDCGSQLTSSISTTSSHHSTPSSSTPSSTRSTEAGTPDSKNGTNALSAGIATPAPDAQPAGSSHAGRSTSAARSQAPSIPAPGPVLTPLCLQQARSNSRLAAATSDAEGLSVPAQVLRAPGHIQRDPQLVRQEHEKFARNCKISDEAIIISPWGPICRERASAGAECAATAIPLLSRSAGHTGLHMQLDDCAQNIYNPQLQPALELAQKFYAALALASWAASQNYFYQSEVRAQAFPPKHSRQAAKQSQQALDAHMRAAQTLLQQLQAGVSGKSGLGVLHDYAARMFARVRKESVQAAGGSYRSAFKLDRISGLAMFLTSYTVDDVSGRALMLHHLSLQ